MASKITLNLDGEIIARLVIGDIGKSSNTESEKKALFVEKELYYMLHAANNAIVDTTYCEDKGYELVIVTMKNGAKYNIPIIGDNKMAIARDVCRVMVHK